MLSFKLLIIIIHITITWEQRKVSELCSISTGKSNTQDKVEDGEYPFYVRSPIIERSTKYLYDEEAVLTVGDGVGTGKVFHYVNGKYDLHQRCYRMYGFTDELNAHYFYHTFSKLFYKRVMAMTAKTSVDSVRLEMIADMEIPCPDIREQEKIGAYFDNLDNLITLHQRQYFCEYTQRNDWEQRKFQWLVDESIIDTPMDGNHGEKHPTTDDYVDTGIPFLMASDIHNGIADIDNCKFISEERANRLDKGFARNEDVLITHKATIGETAILKGLRTDFAMLTPQVTYYRIKDNNRLSQKYLYAWFNSDCFQKEIKTKAAQSTRPYIGISAQRELGISLPKSIEEQGMIGNFIYNLDTLITLHRRVYIQKEGETNIWIQR